MMKIKVYLGIGYPSATHEDEIEIDQDEYEACKSDEQREKLLHSIADEWAGNYIEIWHEVIN